MRTPRDSNPRLLEFAREMRAASTDAERKIWSLLRDRRFVGYKFRRQVPMRGYILDFYCVRAKLAIELDGGQHNEPTMILRDSIRTQALAECGVRVVRFWDHDVLKSPDAVLEKIYRTLCGEELSP